MSITKVDLKTIIFVQKTEVPVGDIKEFKIYGQKVLKEFNRIDELRLQVLDVYKHFFTSRGTPRLSNMGAFPEKIIIKTNEDIPSDILGRIHNFERHGVVFERIKLPVHNWSMSKVNGDSVVPTTMIDLLGRLRIMAKDVYMGKCIYDSISLGLIISNTELEGDKLYTAVKNNSKMLSCLDVLNILDDRKNIVHCINMNTNDSISYKLFLDGKRDIVRVNEFYSTYRPGIIEF